MLPSWSVSNINSSVEKATFTVFSPDDISLKFKQTLLENPKTTKDKLNKYEWQVNKLEAQSPEDFCPKDKVDYPLLELALDSFNVSGYHGSNKSWNTLGQWASRLLENKQELPVNLLFSSVDIPGRYRNRQNNLFIRRSSNFENKMEISSPDGFSVKHKTENINIESKFGVYSLKFTIAESEISVDRQLSINEGSYRKRRL